LLEATHLVAPANVEIGQFRGACDKCVLKIILLQVDEGRHLVPILGQQIESIEQFVALIHLAEFPGHAFLKTGFGNAESVEDLERAFGIADAA
jgi:hypothetical protein